jgi:hypothetical protein
VVVDEARRYHEIRGIDDSVGCAVDLADLGDDAVLDGDIGLARCAAGSIDEASVPDDEVKGHGVPFLGP